MVTQSERGAKVIRLAVRILVAGQAKGWSDALSQAKQQTKEAR